MSSILISSVSAVESAEFAAHLGVRARHAVNAAVVGAVGRVEKLYILPSHDQRRDKHSIAAAIRHGQRYHRILPDAVERVDDWVRPERPPKPEEGQVDGQLSFDAEIERVERELAKLQREHAELVEQRAAAFDDGGPLKAGGPVDPATSAPEPGEIFDPMDAPDDGVPEHDERPALLERARAVGVRVTNQKTPKLLAQVRAAEAAEQKPAVEAADDFFASL